MAYEGPHPFPVPSGGTDDTSFSAFAPVCGGTTSTSALQSATTNFATANLVLTSNGSAALPSFQSPGANFAVNVQTFTSSGTYTPTAGMKYCTLEIVGGGGGSGGCETTGVGEYAASSSGGAGGYCRKTVSAATIGASQTVTIGAGGTAGAAGSGSGGPGGTTSIGAIILAGGGAGGGAGGPTGTGNFWVGAATPGGTGSGGDINARGQPGLQQFIYVLSALVAGVQGSTGGCSFFGGGAEGVGNMGAAIAGFPYGGGASGGAIGPSTTQIPGAAGSAGLAVITEYIFP